MNEVISDANELTPRRLTTILQQNGWLPQGEVLTVETNLTAHFAATVGQLKLGYSEDTPATAPRQLFCKLVSGKKGLNRREVEFYQKVAPHLAGDLVVKCYDGAFNDEGIHLLLEDISTTHFRWGDAPIVPLEYARQMVEGLAGLHNTWWDSPRLLTDLAEPPGKPGVLEFVFDRARDAFGAFSDFMGQRLSARQRQIYAEVLSRWSSPAERANSTQSGKLTLTHGDAHNWNFLYPHAPLRDKVRLIDWEIWHTGPGVADLVYMIALGWPRDYRMEVERGLVEHYHQALIKGGVTGYSGDECWLGYRQLVIPNLVWPLFHWSVGTPASIWERTFTNIWAAFEDLKCREFVK